MELHLIKGKQNIGWWLYAEDRSIDKKIMATREYTILEIEKLIPETKGKLRDSHRYYIDLDIK